MGGIGGPPVSGRPHIGLNPKPSVSGRPHIGLNPKTETLGVRQASHGRDLRAPSVQLPQGDAYLHVVRPGRSRSPHDGMALASRSEGSKHVG